MIFIIPAHQVETFSILLALCEESPQVTGGFPPHRSNKEKLWYSSRHSTWWNQSIWWWYKTPRRPRDVTVMSHWKMKLESLLNMPNFILKKKPQILKCDFQLDGGVLTNNEKQSLSNNIDSILDFLCEAWPLDKVGSYAIFRYICKRHVYTNKGICSYLYVDNLPFILPMYVH